MENMIRIDSLRKSYEDIEALRGLSFEIKKGEMFCLVGPDGAGKTSLIRVLCGLASFDEGSVEVMGMDIRKSRRVVQKNIGYLSQKFSLYGDLSVDENIEFIARIHNVRDFKNRRDQLLEFTNLKPFRSRLAERLSGGMKQKLGLACSLIHKPEILFLDEPTTGVDPVSRREFWKILYGLLKNGMTIVMSTPYMDEAERGSRVAMMNLGETIALDSPSGIKKLINARVCEIVCSPIQAAYRLIKEIPEIEAQIFGDRIVLMLGPEISVNKVREILQEGGILVTDLRQIEPSLENVFIHLIKQR